MMIEAACCRHKSICNTHYDLALGGFTLYGSCNPRYITFIRLSNIILSLFSVANLWYGLISSYAKEIVSGGSEFLDP